MMDCVKNDKRMKEVSMELKHDENEWKNTYLINRR